MVVDIVRRIRWKIVLISAISAFAGILNMAVLALINRDAHLTEINAAGIILFVSVLVASVSINFFSQILLSRLSARTFHDLRERLVRGISHLRVQQIETLGSERLYTALTRDLPSIHGLIIVLPNYVFNFTVSLAGLIYLLFVSVKLFLVFLAFLVVAVIVAKFAINDRAADRFKRRRQVEDDLFSSYEAVIDGNKELKFNCERGVRFFCNDFQPHANAYRDATVSAEFFWNLSQNWSSGVVFLGIGALLFLSVNFGISNSNDLLSFIVIILYMVGPLTILMNSFRTIQTAKIGFSRLVALDLDTAPGRFSDGIPAESFESIELVSLSFAYPKIDDGHDGFCVGPLDLDIRRGEVVFFIGGNGSGKSTAAKLLTGLYEADDGVILFNGDPVTDRDRYFQTFSAVYQDYYLFERVVPRDGRTCDVDEVKAMIDRLELADKVELLNGRLSTTKLSHGQRKRLALLIALFDDSDVYVFDEWAADQDQAFREFFYREFLPDLKRKGKTTIVVSHDEHYYQIADRVVKFDRGRIVSDVVSSDNKQTQDMSKSSVVSP